MKHLMKTTIFDILSKNHEEEEKLFERLVTLMGNIEGNESLPVGNVDKKCLSGS